MGQKSGQLLAVAATQSCAPAAAREYLPYCVRMASQQPQFGARHPVPWQVTDGVEQRRAERVIQESRRQSPRAELQETLHILRERPGILKGRRYRNGLHRAKWSL